MVRVKSLSLKMEQFLPLIIGFIALAYRVYTNFQKEQEKVRKRDPSRPQTPPEATTTHVPTYQYPEVQERYEPVPDLTGEVFTPERPGYEPVYREPKREKVQWEVFHEPKYERMKAEHPVAEKRYSEPAVAEIVRGRAIHAKHNHQFTPHEEEVSRSAYADFDMHDAVIKSVIINRPEWV